MPTLKEIKGRIASVKSTLKITSAMKLVSSAKLRKAQGAIDAMRPYQQQLQRILSTAQGGKALEGWLEAAEGAPRVLVAIGSNASLCGGFNANVIAKVRAIRRPGDIVYSLGRKMADAMRKDGFVSPEDFSALMDHPAYAPAAALAERLLEDFRQGRIASVQLVYNHFVSTARQEPVAEAFLPLAGVETDGGEALPEDVIVEPSAKELLEVLIPKTLKLKLYAAVLDSAAAEHAARTVAMQAATDNGNQLLDELTLQYNKGRQQKITNEILDLAGGQTG